MLYDKRKTFSENVSRYLNNLNSKGGGRLIDFNDEIYFREKWDEVISE